MAAFLTDGNFATKWPIGKARVSYPIAGDLSAYLLVQDFMQAKASYSAASLNTTHYVSMGSASPTDGGAGGDSSAYLVSVGPHEDLGQAIVKWTEVYASVPAARNEYESHAYNFIGYFGSWGVNVATVTGRDRFPRRVLSRVAYAYYRIFATGGDYTAVSSIPTIAAQEYLYNGTSNNIDWLSDSAPETDPTRAEYEAVVAGGAGLGTGAAVGEIVAEESIIRRWQGNIYERATRYIKAI